MAVNVLHSRLATLRLLAVVSFVVIGSEIAIAQSGKILLSQLPKPPAEITDVLDRANVQFTYGSEQEPSSVTAPEGLRVEALTDYKLTYHYLTHSGLHRVGNRQQTVTSIRPASCTLNCQHTVWFRERPAFDTFWTNWLVLHELDHVRISSDPRLELRFKELLAKDEASSQSRNGSSESAKDRAEQVFQQVSSLVEIRYKELDRLTNHGANGLPEGSSLDSLLRPSKQSTVLSP